MSSRFKMSAATASTSNSHVLCGSTPSNIKELEKRYQKYNNYVRTMFMRNFLYMTLSRQLPEKLISIHNYS